MYLPIAVISLVLLVSADSSNATKEVAKKVSQPKTITNSQNIDVNVSSINSLKTDNSQQKRVKVDNHEKMVGFTQTELIKPYTSKNSSKNTTRNSIHFVVHRPGNSSNLFSNKETVNTTTTVDSSVKRPSNLNRCSHSVGIRSTCLRVGKHAKGARRVMKKVIKKAGKSRVQQLADFSYSMKPSWVKKGYVISSIKVTNKMKLGTEGLVTLVKGGVLEKKVALFMESQKGRRMHFLIEIYIRPVAKAYKNQLGSLISNLKSV